MRIIPRRRQVPVDACPPPRRRRRPRPRSGRGHRARQSRQTRRSRVHHIHFSHSLTSHSFRVPRERRLLLSLETRPLGGSTLRLPRLPWRSVGALLGPSLASLTASLKFGFFPPPTNQRYNACTPGGGRKHRKIFTHTFPFGNVSRCVLTFQRFGGAAKGGVLGGAKKERTRWHQSRSREPSSARCE